MTWHRAVVLAGVAVGLVLSVPLPASATPLTINMAGRAYFYDLNTPPPPFQVMMTALGVVQDTSPVLVSLTVDDAAIGDVFGNYAGALLGGRVQLGANLSYRIGPADMQVSSSIPLQSSLAPLQGPTVCCTPATLAPIWAMFNVFHEAAVSAPTLAAALSMAATWPAISFGISFNQPGSPLHTQGNIIYSYLTVTSITVPESSPLIGFIAALLAASLYRHSTSRRLRASHG